MGGGDNQSDTQTYHWENRDIAEALTVLPHQAGYIETVRECLEEADQLDAWRPICILDGDIPIGFAMYGRITEPAYTRLWFDRFLIDRRYQGKGYAKPAIQLILKDMQVHYPNTDIYLSVYEERKLFKNPISERWGKQICLN